MNSRNPLAREFSLADMATEITLIRMEREASVGRIGELVRQKKWNPEEYERRKSRLPILRAIEEKIVAEAAKGEQEQGRLL